jgi:hypothetical protein
MSFPGHEKSPTIHHLENTSKIHPMEDLAGAKQQNIQEVQE